MLESGSVCPRSREGEKQQQQQQQQQEEEEEDRTPQRGWQVWPPSPIPSCRLP